MLNTASRFISNTFNGNGSGSPASFNLPSCSQDLIPEFEIPAAGMTISSVFSSGVSPGENSTAALKAETRASQDETSHWMN